MFISEKGEAEDDVEVVACSVHAKKQPWNGRMRGGGQGRANAWMETYGRQKFSPEVNGF